MVVFAFFNTARLDDIKSKEGESTLLETLTAGNYMETASKFDLSRVTWKSGGTAISGSRSDNQSRVKVPENEDIPEDVYGNILLLNEYEEADGAASGSVTYTYNVKFGEPLEGAFTLNWSADPTIITGITDLRNNRQPVSVTYTNLAGQTGDTPFDGVNIVQTRFDDGTTRTSKIIR